MTADEILETFRASGMTVITKYSELNHEPYIFVQLEGLTLTYWPQDDCWQVAYKARMGKLSTAEVCKILKKTLERK